MARKKGSIGEIWFVLFPLVSALCRSAYFDILEQTFGVTFQPRENAFGSEKLGKRYDCISKLAHIAHQNPREFIMKIEAILPELEKLSPVGAQEVEKHLKKLMYYIYYGSAQKIFEAFPEIAQKYGYNKRKLSPMLAEIIASGKAPPIEQVRAVILQPPPTAVQIGVAGQPISIAEAVQAHLV